MSETHPTDPFEIPRRRLVRHEVRDLIHRSIMEGRQKPGSKLLQQGLARQFGVAQGVVREALLELHAWGIVDIIDNRGVFVADLGGKKLIEAFQIREIHEGLAARLCCGRVLSEQIAELDQMIEQMRAATKNGYSPEHSNLDRQFHLRIIQWSDHGMLARLAENYRIFQKFVGGFGDLKRTHEEHDAIVRAIEANQPDEAERRMREHLRRGWMQIEHEIAAGTFEPHWCLS